MVELFRLEKILNIIEITLSWKSGNWLLESDFFFMWFLAFLMLTVLQQQWRSLCCLLALRSQQLLLSYRWKKPDHLPGKATGLFWDPAATWIITLLLHAACCGSPRMQAMCFFCLACPASPASLFGSRTRSLTVCYLWWNEVTGLVEGHLIIYFIPIIYPHIYLPW